LVARAERNAKDYDSLVYKHIGRADQEDTWRAPPSLATVVSA
jgi:hypothetical protein